MGAWGTAIFSNDTSADVRDEFKRHLQDGASAKDATENILDDFAARDTTNPDNNDVWFGLASTQHSTGHVVPHVLATALELIESPEEMERWDQSLHMRRASALRQLKEKLQTESPPPATFKARKKLTTDLIPGHHLLYTVSESQLLLRVVSLDEDDDGIAPVYTVLDWDGSTSTLTEAASIPPLPRTREDRPYFKFCAVGRKPKKENLVLLDVIGPSTTPGIGTWGLSIMPWKNVLKVVVQSAATLPQTVRTADV